MYVNPSQKNSDERNIDINKERSNQTDKQNSPQQFQVAYNRCFKKDTPLDRRQADSQANIQTASHTTGMQVIQRDVKADREAGRQTDRQTDSRYRRTAGFVAI